MTHPGTSAGIRRTAHGLRIAENHGIIPVSEPSAGAGGGNGTVRGNPDTRNKRNAEG